MKLFSGHVSGTIGTGSRDKDIDETFNDPLVAARFDQIQNSWIEVAEHHEGDISGTFEDILNIVIKWVVGSFVFSAGNGLIIFIGVEIGSLLSTGSLVPGARVIDGILWLAGPAGTLFALAAGGVRFVRFVFDFTRGVRFCSTGFPRNATPKRSLNSY